MLSPPLYLGPVFSPPVCFLKYISALIPFSTHFSSSVCVLLMQHIFSFCCLLTSFLHPGVCSAVVLPQLSSARPHTHPIPTYSSLPQVISITVSFPEAVSLSLLSLLYNVSPSCVASSSPSANSTHIGFCRRRVYIYTIKAYIFRILG